MGSSAFLMLALRNWRLIASGLAAVALSLVLFNAYRTVKGWQRDAAELTVVQGQLDQANKELSDGAGRIDAVAARLDAIAQVQARTDSRIARFDGNLSQLKDNAFRSFADAIPPVPSCDYVPSVRGVFERLLAAPGEPAAGALAPGGETGLPAAGAAPDAMPGREPAPLEHGGPLLPGVYEAGRKPRLRPGTHARGDGAARRGRHSVGLEGTKLKAGTRGALRNAVSRVGGSFLSGLSLIGAALYETYRDDVVA